MVHVSMYRRISAKEREAMALSEAIKSGNINRVRSSIASGYDVNAKTPKGLTALMMASQNGHLELVKTLLKAGADVNAKRKDVTFPDSALYMASEKDHKDVVKLLKEYGAKW